MTQLFIFCDKSAVVNMKMEYLRE